MRSYRKHIAGTLIAALAAGLLVSCGQPSKSGGTEEKPDIPVLDPTVSGTGADQEEPMAMGRYRETEMKLPEELEGGSLIRFLKGENGILELYTAQREFSGKAAQSFRYQYMDGSWERDEDWPGDGVMKERNLDLMNVFYGQDGRYYLGGADEDYIYHLLKLEPDGTAEEVLEEVFKPEEGKDYGIMPPKVEILENGNFLVYDYWEVYLYNPSGSRMFSVAKDFSGTTSDARGFCQGDEFVTFNQGNMVKYDLRNGRVTETIDCGDIDDNRQETQLFGDGAGGMYAVNEKGLSHLIKDGTLWEVLIDGSLNHMGMRSLIMRDFVQGDQEEFYGAYTGEAGKKICLFRYEYDPHMTAVPPETLTIYSLADNSTVRQAVAQFQSDHPEVRVEMRAASENGGTVTDEMIQGLNTELLSGKGADVLILDGLPVDAYVEKGVLMDLGGLVEELEESGDMMNNLLEGFREEDGKIWQVPAKIGFPLLVGKPEAAQAYSSLSSMAAYQGERPLMSIDNYENMLRKISRLCYEELFGKDMAVKERDVLIRYLESVKALGEASGCQTVFSEAEMEEKNVTNNVISDGMTRDVIDFDRGQCDCGMQEITGYSRLSFPVEVRRINPGSVMVPAGKIYLPTAMAGINQSTANGDMAKEFIRCLLSYEVQKEDLYDGLPVNRKALDALTRSDSRDNFSEGVGYRDGYHLSAGWPTLEEREEMAAMVETLTVPAIVDETVMKMIVEGSRDYFDGKKTVEQAADDILRKMSIYLAE